MANSVDAARRRARSHAEHAPASPMLRRAASSRRARLRQPRVVCRYEVSPYRHGKYIGGGEPRQHVQHSLLSAGGVAVPSHVATGNALDVASHVAGVHGAPRWCNGHNVRYAHPRRQRDVAWRAAPARVCPVVVAA